MDDSCAQVFKSKEITTICNTEDSEFFLLSRQVQIFEGFILTGFGWLVGLVLVSFFGFFLGLG